MIDNQSNSSNRVFGLDLMRATAILMVLCSHILWIYPHPNTLISQVFTLFGFWGVEIFFVLSGFLIGRILYNLYMQEDFTIKTVLHFLKRRWFRTLPNYFLVLLLAIFLEWSIGYPLKDLGFYFLFLQNFASPMKPFFPESWSLSVEEFAYLITPFTLLSATFFKPKNKSKRFILVVILLIMVFFINKITYNFSTSNTTLTQWNLSLKAVVIYRIDAILIGIAASWISLNFTGLWEKQKINLAFLGCTLVVFKFVGVGYFHILIDSHPFFWNVLYLPFTSIIFALFLPLLSNWKFETNPLTKPITFVSLISYSIYLMHYSIILQMMKYFVDTTFFTTIQLHLFAFSYLIVTFFVSFLLYKYFEKPIMNLRGN
ncbi:acyltransferase [Flavobacterium sp. GT3R68]|uniref:acyltransferase family protein n=1 Tax=Flavobacterium sp. GT3R68 TaxID=2594437 RepID=UPI00131550F1|nr:acyltransferase [Flavobacterium sp. GT3R68]